MRRFLVVALLLFAVGLDQGVGRVLPLTAKDVCLMLRSGYSSEAVQQELLARRFAGTCDAVAEKSLREAGAAPALVDAIKSGSYKSAPGDAQTAQDLLAAQTKRHALEAEQNRKFNTLYQDQLRRSRAAGIVQGETSAVITNLLKGDLVRWKDGSLGRFDDEVLGKKRFIALYFSARWCSPCRQFTPQLVEYYNRVSAQHPDFEVVLISKDRSPGEMETYMRETNMPWPAIEFDKLANKGELKKYAGDGIPCLVLLDAGGKVISDTYAGKNRVGPEKVLTDLDAIFSKDPGATTASR